MTKLREEAGEKSRLEPGWVSRLSKILPLILARTAHWVNAPAMGALCPVHSCGPVVGLWISAWETGAPFLYALERSAAVEGEKEDRLRWPQKLGRLLTMPLVRRRQG